MVLEELRLAVRLVGEEETQEGLGILMEILALLEHYRLVPQGLLELAELVRLEVKATKIIRIVWMAIVTYAVAMGLQEV